MGKKLAVEKLRDEMEYLQTWQQKSVRSCLKMHSLVGLICIILFFLEIFEILNTLNEFLSKYIKSDC